MPKAIIKMH